MQGVSEGGEPAALTMQNQRGQQAKRRPAAPSGLDENADGRSAAARLHGQDGDTAEGVQRL